MLEVQRRSVASTKVNKPTDFLARNRKAAVRSTKPPDKAKKDESGKRPPAKQRASNRPVKAQPPSAAGTVTISKDYLDQLMRMSVVGSQQPSAAAAAPAEVRHVEPTNIPGLENHTSQPSVPGFQQEHPDPRFTMGGMAPPQQQLVRAQHAEPDAHLSAVGMAPVGASSPHKASNLTKDEQWLKDLSSQAEEQRRRRLVQKEREKHKTPEDYSPWGRPGGGAPIRDESGAVVNAYRNRAKHGQIADTTVEPVARQQYISHDLSPPAHPGSHDLRGSYSTPSKREPTPEDYSPWGRPGGGAPIRDESGAVVNAYRNRAKHGQIADTTKKSVAKQHYASHSKQQAPIVARQPQHHSSHDPHPPQPSIASELQIDSSPCHARGAGPYVDKYVQQDLDRQRQKNLDNIAFIKAQIAEKERKKLEAKVEQEREEQEEGARLARERMRMEREFQQEQLRKRAKEEEATQRICLLQQQIDQASERAMAAKLEAKTSKLSPRHQHHKLAPPAPQHTGGQMRSSQNSKFDSVLRSPSMLNAPASTVEHQHHQPPSHPPRADNRGTIRQQRHQQQGGRRIKEDKGMSARRRPSRIPVPEKSQRKIDQRDNGISKRRATSPVVNGNTRRVKGQPEARRVARPVQNKLQRQYHHHNSPKRTAVSPPPPPARAASPPVPALAKRLAKQPLVAAEPARQPSPPIARQTSPPVPALAKKMKQQSDRQTPPPAARNSSPHVVRQLAGRPSSPPVPALAKKLHSDEDLGNSTSRQNLALENANLGINRPPSCDLIAAPVSSVPRLPSVTTATTKEAVTSHDNMLRQPDQKLNRQKTILLELAMLREGIISYTEGIDKRVDRILSKKTCNF